MRHAWAGYEAHAWGYDELCPVSMKVVAELAGEHAVARLQRCLGTASWPGRGPLLLPCGMPAPTPLAARPLRPCRPSHRPGQGKNDFGGLGATIIDSLDTLHMMGAPGL